MNEETAQQMLAELKSLRRTNLIASIVALAFLVAVCVYVPIRMRAISAAKRPHPDTASAPQPNTWDTVRSAINHFDYDNAAVVTRSIVQKYPNDWYGYAYLGNIALNLNNPKEAETDYARACELLPSEANLKMLDAIRKRLANDAKAAPSH